MNVDGGPAGRLRHADDWRVHPKSCGPSSLRELYRRGLEATAGQSDEAGRAKHSALAEKYESLSKVEEPC